MDQRTAHVAIYDALADWEVGHLLAELRTGRFTRTPFSVVAVAESPGAVTTMGGLRLTPNVLVEEVDPAESDLLILPGAEMWDTGGGQAFVALASRFLRAGVPVAAICGATAGLARGGLLEDRRHTSAAATYLEATGYGGRDRYVEARAVSDGDLITAGPQSPVQFACATLQRLGVAPPYVLDAYEAMFGRGDAHAFSVLQRAAEAA